MVKVGPLVRAGVRMDEGGESKERFSFLRSPADATTRPALPSLLSPPFPSSPLSLFLSTPSSCTLATRVDGDPRRVGLTTRQGRFEAGVLDDSLSRSGGDDADVDASCRVPTYTSGQASTSKTRMCSRVIVVCRQTSLCLRRLV